MAGLDLPDLEPAFRTICITLAIAVPLALWKVLEVIVFLFTNVSISVG